METVAKKQELEDSADRAKRQLVRAGQLIGGLGGEKTRWLSSITTLQSCLTNLVGDMALAAGFISYLGPFNAHFRDKIVVQWERACRELGVPCSDKFSLLTALAEPVTLRQWQLRGLPADDFSSENGILTTLGRRWPLMIGE
jgi:dynein heavy chain